MFFLKLLRKYYIYIVVFVLNTTVFFFALTYLQNMYADLIEKKNNVVGVEKIINLSRDIGSNYDKIRKKVEVLADFVRDHAQSDNSEIEFFVRDKLLARNMTSFFNRKNDDYILSYMVAPDDSLSLIRKDEHDYSGYAFSFSDPSSQYYLEIAKRNPDNFVIQGPILSPKTHEVVVIGRKAVSVDDRYWGYVGVVVDFFKFLDAMNIDAGEDDLFIYSIHAPSYYGSNDFLWGDNSLFKKNSSNVRHKSLFFGKQRWDIALKVKKTDEEILSDKAIIIVMFLLYLLCLFISFYAVKLVYNVKFMYSVDRITGEMSHDSFFNFLKNSLKEHHEHGIIVLELIHFNQINLRYSFRDGDVILSEITRKIRSVVHFNDRICRVGAEFIIFMPNIKSVIDIQRVVTDLKELLNTQVEINNCFVDLKVVVGSTSTIESGRDFVEIMQEINQSIYEQKKHMTFYLRSSDREEGKTADKDADGKASSQDETLRQNLTSDNTEPIVKPQMAVAEQDKKY